MRKIYKVLFFGVLVILISSCVSSIDCKCDVPGAAVVKVFMDTDGIPNVNIETLPVYPGQKVVFDGLSEFELDFKRDPQDPDRKDIKFKSKNGKITVKISKKYEELLARQSKERKLNENYILIKYSVIAEGKERDPDFKILPQSPK